jgi:hypothetical protein
VVFVLLECLIFAQAARAQSDNGDKQGLTFGGAVCAGLGVAGVFFSPLAIVAIGCAAGVAAGSAANNGSGSPQWGAQAGGCAWASDGAGGMTCQPTTGGATGDWGGSGVTCTWDNVDDPCWSDSGSGIGGGSAAGGMLDAPANDSPDARHSTGTRTQPTTETQQQTFTARWQDWMCKTLKMGCS